jgi:hypothetical protein
MEASRRIVEAIALVYDDFARRLEDDPAFSGFVDRLVTESLRVEQRSKLDYYVRLLTASVPKEGPDSDDRVRLLKALDELELHHLRLFHTMAITDAVPRDYHDVLLGDDGSKADLIELLHSILGGNREDLARDIALLQRLALIRSDGWMSWNLRLQLTQFGLAFEAFAAGEHGRSRPRWEVALEAREPPAVDELALDFAVPAHDPHLSWERGGLFIVSRAFDEQDDPVKVRRLADAYVDRIQMLRRLRWLSPDELQTGTVYARVGDVITSHSSYVVWTKEPPNPTEAWPRRNIVQMADELMDEDLVFRSALGLYRDREFSSLAATLRTIERAGKVSELAAYPDLSEDDLDAVRAIGPSIGRPVLPLEPRIGIDHADEVVRAALTAWICVASGVWRSLMRMDRVDIS